MVTCSAERSDSCGFISKMIFVNGYKGDWEDFRFILFYFCAYYKVHSDEKCINI